MVVVGVGVGVEGGRRQLGEVRRGRDVECRRGAEWCCWTGPDIWVEEVVVGELLVRSALPAMASR